MDGADGINAEIEQSEPEGRSKEITWFEIFYDLTMAAAISRAGDLLFVDPSWSNTALVFGGVLIVFSIWLLTTLLYGVTHTDEIWRKLLLLIQLILVIVAALATGADGLQNWVGFVAIAGALLITAVLFLTTKTNVASLNRQIRRLAIFIGFTITIFLLSAIISIPTSTEQDVVWIPPVLFLAVIVLLVATLGGFLRRVMAENQLDLGFTQSRFEEWVLILVGEMAARLILALSLEGTIPSPGFFILTFVMTFAVWVIYILGISPSGIPRTVARVRWWIIGHAFFLFAGVATIAAFQKFISIDFRKEYVDSVVDWSPLPIFGILIAVLIVMASQRLKGRIDTELPHMRTVSGGRLMARLREERQLVLVIQYTCAGGAALLWLMYYLFPITGVPWYSVLGALFLIVNAIALAVVGRVR